MINEMLRSELIAMRAEDLVQVSHILAPFRDRDGRSFLTGRLLVA